MYALKVKQQAHRELSQSLRILHAVAFGSFSRPGVLLLPLWINHVRILNVEVWVLKAAVSQRGRRDVSGSHNQVILEPPLTLPRLPLVLSPAPSTRSSWLDSYTETYQIFTLTFSNVYIIYIIFYKIFTCHAKYTLYFCCTVLFLLQARNFMVAHSPNREELCQGM